VIRAIMVASVAVLACTACGANVHPKTQPKTQTKTATRAQKKQCRNQAAALAKIQRDTAALRRAKTEAAMSTLTDRFLLHVATAPISNLQRNRLIDHAAAAVAVTCPQCFQALEAARPIPAIRAGQISCAS
jgi:Mg-chelatase subunit ChlI